MSAQPARAYFGIGEVLARLRAEFPDVSVSKIRFLESEGLIEPARAPSGYRRFAVADVERLRYILTAQRDEYLPLRVIKERLLPALPGRPGAEDGAGPGRSGSASSGSSRAGAANSGAARAGAAGDPGDLVSRRELLASTGIDADQLADLETFGLVRRVGRGYPRDALRAASAAAMLGRYGVEARHLRAVRAAAEREISLIEQLVAPVLRQRKPQARQQAGQTAREIAALTLRLHGALVEAALAEAGFAGDDLSELAAGTRAAGTRAGGRLAGGAAAGGGLAGGAATDGYGGASA